MTTRSVKLASTGVFAVAPAVLFTVPPGQTWIVKSAIAGNDSGVAASITLYGLNPGANPAYIFLAQALANGARAEWNGWLVLAPGDQLVTAAPVGAVELWVSGAKLMGTA